MPGPRQLHKSENGLNLTVHVQVLEIFCDAFAPNTNSSKCTWIFILFIDSDIGIEAYSVAKCKWGCIYDCTLACIVPAYTREMHSENWWEFLKISAAFMLAPIGQSTCRPGAERIKRVDQVIVQASTNRLAFVGRGEL